MSNETRQCQNCKTEFIIGPDDQAFYDRIKVPAPTFCPPCRLQRRLAFRNERALYKRQCDLCQKDFISTYSPDKPYVVYCNPCWWSDKWNASDYAQDFDPKRSFFEQVYELSQKVPHMGVFAPYTTLQNSEYTNLVSNLKNCYLIFNSDFDENCAYGTEIESSKDCIDNLMIENCELSCENVNCQKCYEAFYSIDCDSCHGVWFSKNLSGCSNCFGCVNLRNKKFHFFNEPLTEAEYKKRINELNLTAAKIKELKEKLQKLAVRFPVKFAHVQQNKNSTGEYIYNSKNTVRSYIATGGENCKYCMWLLIAPVKDCWDYTEFGNNVELAYESITLGENMSICKFSRQSYNNCRDLEYSLYCISSSDLFGCVSMRSKKYSILNKEYFKEEYGSLRYQIIEQMKDVPHKDKRGREYTYGEFFPIEHSQFAYNETNAQEHFPLTKEQALAEGYTWKDSDEKQHSVTKPARDLPETSENINESILGETIGCADEGKCSHACTRAFRLIPQEVEFYKRMKLPLPRLCPNCRHGERLALRNPISLTKRKCMCGGRQSESGIYANTGTHPHGEAACPNEFQTSYAPDRPEIVYCEQCYNSEVV